MMASYEDFAEFQDAWTRSYGRLAGIFSAQLRSRSGRVVELGCGKGQLTIQLAEMLPRSEIIGVDNYSGSYRGDLLPFRSSLRKARLTGRVRVIVSDASRWLERRRGSAIGAIISNEFLPELDSDRMLRLLGECRRILRPGGVTIHSFLSPIPKNGRQRLLIEADSDERWTSTPPPAWFSPPPRLVRKQMRAVGFREISMVTARNDLRIRGRAAEEFLEDIGMKPAFWKRYRARLTTSGLEMPDWVIVHGMKSGDSPSRRSLR